MKASRAVEYILAVYLVICPWILLGLHWIYGFDHQDAMAMILAGAISGFGLFILIMILEGVVD